MKDPYQIGHRLDTAANYVRNNPILMAGEYGLTSDTAEYKIGDGVTHWNDLPTYKHWNGLTPVPEAPDATLNKESHKAIENAAVATKFEEVDNQIKELERPQPGGGGSGVTKYEQLPDKPSIGGVVLEGDKTPDQLGLQPKMEGTTVATINGTPIPFGGNVNLPGGEGGGAAIIVDKDLNPDSPNAIQNGTVAKKLSELDAINKGLTGNTQTYTLKKSKPGMEIVAFKDFKAFKGSIIAVTVKSELTIKRIVIECYALNSEGSSSPHRLYSGAIDKNEEYQYVLDFDARSIQFYAETTESSGNVDFLVKILGANESTDILRKRVDVLEKPMSGSRLEEKSIGLSKLDNSLIQTPKNLLNLNDPDFVDNSYLDDRGRITPNMRYCISPFIPLTSGTLICSSKGRVNEGGGFICYYDSEKKETAKSEMLTNAGGKATWKEGVAFTRFSLNKGDISNPIDNEFQIEKGEKVTFYEPYRLIFKKDLMPSAGVDTALYDSALGAKSEIMTIPTMQAFEVKKMKDFPLNLKKGLCMSFRCKIGGDFTYLQVGKGYQSYRGDYIKIDATNITHQHWENGPSEQGTPIPHGLTISEFISINMYGDNSGKLHVSLMSKSGLYKHVFTDWKYEANGDAFIRNATEITDVTFSATNKDFKLPVWMFGDSYFGITTNRWPGALRDLGFFNVLIDGLAGQSSTGAYSELVRCLKFATPKYVVWCLGMNDSDGAFTSTFDKVKNICEQKGITLIGCTVPTVPDRNKENITKSVKESGYRYIDLYKASGANSQGVWYDGYISEDHLHPSELGAKAQAMQVVVDFPEIMQYGLLNADGTLDGSTGDK